MQRLIAATVLFFLPIAALADETTETMPPTDRLQPRTVTTPVGAGPAVLEVLGVLAQLYSFYDQGQPLERETREAMKSEMRSIQLALLRSGSKGALVEAVYVWNPTDALDKAPKAPVGYTERLERLKYFGDGETPAAAYASALEEAKRNPATLSPARRPGEATKFRRLFWVEPESGKIKITEIDEKKYRTEALVKFNNDAVRIAAIENSKTSTLKSQLDRMADNSTTKDLKDQAQRLRASLADFQRQRQGLELQMRKDLAKAAAANDDANKMALTQAIASLGSVFAGEASEPPPAPPGSSNTTYEYYSRLTETYHNGRKIQATTEELWRQYVQDDKVPKGCNGVCPELKQAP